MAYEKISHFQLNSVKVKRQFLYYSKRKTTENKTKIYKSNRIYKEETLLIDLDDLKQLYPDNEVDFMNFSISPNEKYLAIVLTINGNEFGNTHIYNLENNNFTNIVHPNSRSFEVEWLSDEAYFYIFFPNAYKTDGTGFNHLEIKYHKIGTELLEDYVVFSEKNNPEITDLGYSNFFDVNYYKESNTILLYHIKETEQFLSIYKTQWEEKHTKPLEQLCTFDDKVYSPLLFNNEIYFFTSKFNTYLELRKSALNQFSIEKSTLLFKSETEFPTLEITKNKNALYFTTNTNGYTKLYALVKDNISEIPFKEKGSIVLGYATEEDFCPFVFTSFKTPPTYYTIRDLHIGISDIFKNQFGDTSLLDNLQVLNTEYTSYDGEKIPISLVFNKDIIKNEKNKCLINAYGSYGHMYLQYFDHINLYWLLNEKAIIAIAHVRGGGEKGLEWHEAGKKKNKHNTWKDLIAAGEYLIEEKYTSSAYLACQGTSAGGITVGMVANTRPELFKSIFSNVGSNTASRRGRNVAGGLSEFGDPSIEEDYDTLLKMDVYENIKHQNHPNMLFTAGMQDDRVDYWQPAKAAAKFKKTNFAESKIAYIAYENFGHGWSGSKKVNVKYRANQHAFLLKTLS